MTALEVSYKYGVQPGENEMRALARVREVYGIRAMRFDEKQHSIRVEYDASRLNEETVEALLRNAGLDLTGKLALV